jgi:RNA polymerase sigma-B factor
VTLPPSGGGAAPEEEVGATASHSSAGAESSRHRRGVQTADRQETRELLRKYQESRDPAIRDRLVELNGDLVHFIARRFANRGEPLEDIEQVGFLGLINAIERFDPSLENEFSTFATPTIAGEIRRYFRDKSWAVRVPRRLQENHQKVTAAQQQLSGSLGRQPSIAEIAEHLELDVDDVLEALEVAPARHSVSFDTPAGGDNENASLGELLGSDDEDLQRVEMRQLVEQAMQHLTPRERQIMALRFIEELPQTEVAERLGISQMHVSRLQRAAMEQMRRELPDAAGALPGK